MPDHDLGGLLAKELSYAELRDSEDLRRLALAADAWAAAPTRREAAGLRSHHPARRGSGSLRELPEELAGALADLRDEYRLFHWHLEFPDVFAHGGFDLVLGNPPWDTLSPDVKEFFAVYDRQVRLRIARASGRSWTAPQVARDRPRVAPQLPCALRLGARLQERRPLPPVRAREPRQGRLQRLPDVRRDRARDHGEGGYTAQIVPENLANGANAAAIRRELLDNRRLISCSRSRNRRGLVPGRPPETNSVCTPRAAGDDSGCFRGRVPHQQP